MKMKTITMPRGYDRLHVELPGCIVNIQTGLRDAEGREVTRVDVEADGDRYKGDPEWWCVPGDCDNKGVVARVIRGPQKD